MKVKLDREHKLNIKALKLGVKYDNEQDDIIMPDGRNFYEYCW